jgi:hypothetical protein
MFINEKFLHENIGSVGVKDRRTRIKINSIDSKYSLYKLNLLPINYWWLNDKQLNGMSEKMLIIWMIEHNLKWVLV